MKKIYDRSLVCLFFVMLSVSSALAKDETLYGDRLVVSINNQPYSQRQVEAYIAIKESLRSGDQTVALVDRHNWKSALAVFCEEILILQESQRLGSLQVTEQIYKKYLLQIKKILKQDKGFYETVQRLGLSEVEIRKNMENALRVASFRSSKDKQAAVNNLANKETKLSKAKWLEDLEERSVIRRYKDASDYVDIRPAMGGRSRER